MMMIRKTTMTLSVAIWLAISSLLLPGSLSAADLTVADGVVVKFGPDAQLVVRDRLVTGSGVVFTSRNDDTVGGQTGAAAATPAVGDWRGVRLEKSAAAYGAMTMKDIAIRYAGSGNEAALFVRGFNPTLQYLQITDSVTGLRLLGASPNISGSSFARNNVGIEADGNSAPVISVTQFSGNTGQAVLNKTPTTIIQATGNWWGHVSGPQDPVANPAGQGDAVSTGVNYGNFLVTAPLLNPSIHLAVPAAFYEQQSIAFDLACVNATEYRIAENDAFAGVSFQPLVNGRATVTYTLSAGDGRKPVSVQFRNATGAVVTAALAGGVLIDTQLPTVAINNPANGSVINQPITVEISASDASGIARVEIWLDGELLATRTAAPYTYYWDTAAVPDGPHEFKALAYDQVGRSNQQVSTITFAREVMPPDLEGPQLTHAAFAGTALANGMTLTHSGSVTVSASDRSGISRIELLLDGQMIATAVGNGNYTAALDLGQIANGPHTLILRATDSLGNISSLTYDVIVAHAVPNAPVITQPANGLVTRTASLAVSGTAQAGSSVQVLNNNQPVGAPVTAGSDGRFAATITLAAGENRLQATATDQHGISAASAVVTVTLDLNVPSGPVNLVATAQVQGKIKLTWTKPTDASVVGFDLYRAEASFNGIGEAVKVNGSRLTATTYEDMPPRDGMWYYRVVSVNAAGTPSEPGNLAQALADATPPKALSLVYQSQGKYDVATGRYGQGRVGVTLTVSETLPSAPYLALMPVGGTPLVVELTRISDTTYTGSLQIDAATPSGVANAIFSARDAVGNRGADIESGATLKIDTEGPILAGITINPPAPVKNDTVQTVTATFTLSKAMKPGSAPQIAWQLSGPVRQPVTIVGLIAQNATTWQGNFPLPGDAGLGSPETLSFTYQGIDDLDNPSTKISATNRFQVYQGDLPPLGIPAALTAKALPGGKVRLEWQAVAEAAAYQIYRQAPGETALQPLARVSATTYTDATPADGHYIYAVASVRQDNGQESLSGQSAPVEIDASASAPGAPQNLILRLTGQGIVAEWQAPLASPVASYNLYRADGVSITSITGLTPLKTGLKQTIALDTTPSATQSAYVVTALDAAGNESALSNSAYLNASLLPVTNLKVEQLGNALPVITWNAPNGNVAGYRVYLGPDNNRILLTPSTITALNYTDTGYTAGERRYTIATVDSQGEEMARSVLLPAVNTQIAGGLPVKRGIMNKLQVQVTNTSAATLDNLRVVVRLPINRDATQFKEHYSERISLGANQTRLLPVIVGGYADLPAQPTARVGVEITPNEGELIRIARDQVIEAGDSALVVGISPEEFTRGATGKVRLTIDNTSEVDLELLTAINNGANPSSELRFKLLDADGNVLSTQSYHQALGANVITLTNGLTVARIPAGASYLSDRFTLAVPGASPNLLKIRLEVDKIRYHSGQEDEVIITGRGSEKTVNLSETAYLGEVTAVEPIISFGDQDILITGRALDRGTMTPLGGSRLKLVFNQQGFERIVEVTADSAGQFVHSFKPTLSDAGLYQVAAIHPEMTDRPVQKAFTINRVSVGPTPYKLDVPRNYAFSIPLIAKAGVGTAAGNLRLVADGVVPAGITLQLPAPVNLTERQTLNLPLVFTADNAAPASGVLKFNVLAEAQGTTPIGAVQINYTLSEARPYLVSTPNYLETGLARGDSQIESLIIENKGLQDALNLHFSLSEADGVMAAPGWVTLVSQADGTLAIGQKRAIDLNFTPPANLAEGIYNFKLNVEGDNIAKQSLNLYASITQSGQGNALFKASDIYTATLDKQGNLIPGLAGATVTLQNEDVASVTYQGVTDSQGEAYFQNIPAGRYTFRARAGNHQEAGGRLQIKPGITVNQPVFLDYNLIQVEWTVKEITIEDRYEVILNATFETDVPAAVLVLAPGVVNLPKMATGDIFYGELNLQNYGLIRADNLQVTLPGDDEFFKYEFLISLPTSLEAKQRLTIPYRIVALKSLDDSGEASGGGCYSYSKQLQVKANYICANGQIGQCGSSNQWVTASSSTCAGGGGAGGGVGGGGGWSGVGGGSGFGGGGASYQSIPGLPPCTKCDAKCCAAVGAQGGGQ
jgi:fibronectin type 3 domain-containing protein/uncharacterized membrane protein YgcG